MLGSLRALPWADLFSPFGAGSLREERGFFEEFEEFMCQFE